MTKRLYAYTLSGTFEWDDTDPDDSEKTISFEEWVQGPDLGYDASNSSHILYALGEMGVEPTKHTLTEIPAETLREIDDKIADLEAQKQKLFDSLI